MTKKSNQSKSSNSTSCSSSAKNDDSVSRYGFSIDDYDITTSGSSSECTGLIPSLPKSDDEIDAYEDVVPYMPPKFKTANDNSKGPGK